MKIMGLLGPPTLARNCFSTLPLNNIYSFNPKSKKKKKRRNLTPLNNFPNSPLISFFGFAPICKEGESLSLLRCLTCESKGNIIYY